NAILGRSYPNVAFLAAIASTAAPATAATPSAIAVTIIGPRGGVGSLQVLIADIGVDIAASRPFHGEALVLPGRHVGRRVITRGMRLGSCRFAFQPHSETRAFRRRHCHAQAFLARLPAAAASSPPSPPPAGRFAVFGAPLAGLGRFSRLGGVRVD